MTPIEDRIAVWRKHAERCLEEAQACDASAQGLRPRMIGHTVRQYRELAIENRARAEVLTQCAEEAERALERAGDPDDEYHDQQDQQDGHGPRVPGALGSDLLK